MRELVAPLLLLAVGFNGLLAGVSLNKSTVELPAGRRIGPLAFSEFSRAADLGNGRILYPLLGLVSPSLVLAAGPLVLATVPSSPSLVALVVSAMVVSVAHVLTTLGAAPKMLRIGQLGSDVPALTSHYHSFQRWTSARTALQVAALVLLLSVLAILLGGA